MKNMKHVLLAAALGMGSVLWAENEFRIQPTAGWKKDGDVCTLDYGTAQKGPVYLFMDVKPDTFYRISWQVRRANPEVPAIALWVETSRKHIAQFEGENRVHYWNSGKETKLKLRFDLDRGAAGQIKLGNIRVEEVDSKELLNNLVPNGDFEKGGIGDFWQATNGSVPESASLVKSPDFFSGSRSLCLKPSPKGERYPIRSAYMPAIPGKKAVLTFWAKSHGEAALGCTIDCSSPTNIHTGKHPHKSTSFKLTPDWNEYRLEYEVPDDLSTYPALTDRMARIWFSNSGKDTIYIDNVEFRQAAEDK